MKCCSIDCVPPGIITSQALQLGLRALRAQYAYASARTLSRSIIFTSNSLQNPRKILLDVSFHARLNVFPGPAWQLPLHGKIAHLRSEVPRNGRTPRWQLAFSGTEIAEAYPGFRDSKFLYGCKNSEGENDELMSAELIVEDGEHWNKTFRNFPEGLYQ